MEKVTKEQMFKNKKSHSKKQIKKQIKKTSIHKRVYRGKLKKTKKTLTSSHY